MADSFFGYDPSCPPPGLGKGHTTKAKGHHDGESLIPRKGDEDNIDLLNDETFGDGGVWDYDAAEKANLGESLYEDDSMGVDSAYSTAEKQRRDDEEFSEMPQMEQSLSAMVVDDEDEINDPAIVNMSKCRPIPKPIFDRKQNLDDLFGPASPPGLLDTEDLVSPSHKNIWRPPDKEHFNFDSPGHQHQGPSIVTAGSGRPAPASQPGRNIQQERRKSGPMTVEELERQLRDRSVPQCQSPPLGGTPMPIGTPPHHHHMPIGTPPQHSVPPRPFFHTPHTAHGQGPWISTPGPTPNRVSPPQVVPQQQTPQQQMQGQVHPGFMNQPPRGVSVRSESPFQPGGMRQTPSPTMIGPPAVDNRGMPLNLSPAMIAKLYPHLLRTPVGQIRGGMHMNAPQTAHAGRISPPNMNMNHSYMHGTPQGPPRMPQRLPYTDPTHQRQYNRERWQEDQYDRQYYNNQNRGGYNRGYQGEGDYRGNQGYRGGRGGYNNSYHQQYNEPREPEDEYANLMTQREKDWIIKIQMIQLTSENPYVDDYYYTQYKMKQLALERRRQRGQGGDDKEPKLLLPQFAKVEQSAYSPAQFEGTLGKLTASSVHNPRQIIDAKVTAGDVEMKGGKYRQLLLYIEQIYNVLLQVDDLEKQVLALPPEEREALYSERHTKINQMFAKLHCDSNAPEQFVMYMSIRKGKKLVNRMMPLLNKDQLVSIVLATLKNLPILIKKDVLDEVLPDLYNNVSQVIKNACMQDLVMFGLAMQHAAVPTSQTNPIMSALQNKFGVSSVCCMMSRAETIYIESPMDVDNSQQDQWSDFVIVIGDTLSNANERTLTLPKPLEKFHNLIAHFERVLSRNVLSGLEDRLRAWTQG